MINTTRHHPFLESDRFMIINAAADSPPTYEAHTHIYSCTSSKIINLHTHRVLHGLDKIVFSQKFSCRVELPPQLNYLLSHNFLLNLIEKETPRAAVLALEVPIGMDSTVRGVESSRSLSTYNQMVGQQIEIFTASRRSRRFDDGC